MILRLDSGVRGISEDFNRFFSRLFAHDKRFFCRFSEILETQEPGSRKLRVHVFFGPEPDWIPTRVVFSLIFSTFGV